MTCPRCKDRIITTADGPLCNCTGLSKPGPRAAFERAAAVVRQVHGTKPVRVVHAGRER